VNGVVRACYEHDLPAKAQSEARPSAIRFDGPDDRLPACVKVHVLDRHPLLTLPPITGQHLALREDHRVSAGEVVGKIFEARRHDAK
jgi:hypothetical protein